LLEFKISSQCPCIDDDDFVTPLVNGDHIRSGRLLAPLYISGHGVAPSRELPHLDRLDGTLFGIR
jgi:hypothetical protein